MKKDRAREIAILASFLCILTCLISENRDKIHVQTINVFFSTLACLLVSYIEKEEDIMPSSWKIASRSCDESGIFLGLTIIPRN